MPSFVCQFCRAETGSSGGLKAHLASCSHYAWWQKNFPSRSGAPQPADETLERCPFCGYGFEKAELEEHQHSCGQRRWIRLNFNEEGIPAKVDKREPPIPAPQPREDRPGWRGLLKKVLGEGKEAPIARLSTAIEKTNEIHDDAAFNAARRGMMAALAIWAEGTPVQFPMAIGVAERLAGAAIDLERTLDRLHALAPMRVQRELSYLEDAGRTGPEVAEKRRVLAECDATSQKAASQRVRLQELAASLESMKRRALGGEAPAEIAVELAPAPAVEPDGFADTMVRPRDGRAPKPPVSLDKQTFERLIPGGLGFSGQKEIGAYRIMGLLGSGGMGVVYDALAPNGQRVALKTIRPPEDEGGGEALEKRLRRECQILRRVDHPGCVKLLEIGTNDGEIFLALSRVEGVPLASLLRERQLTLEETVGLGMELADPLAYLHASGIVHRDLKPDNVMIQRDGHAVITDFGISRALGGTEITEAGVVIGTPGYVAPEVVTGGEVTPAADQWSLGRLLFRCAAGKVPAPKSSGSFSARLREGTLIPWERYPAAREWAPLRAVLEKMLRDRPEDRFSDLAEVEVALSELGAAAALPAGADKKT